MVQPSGSEPDELRL